MRRCTFQVSLWNLQERKMDDESETVQLNMRRAVVAAVMIAVAVLQSAPTRAWEIKSVTRAQPGLATELRVYAATLPPCAQKIIATRLRIVLLADSIPGTVESQVIDATSFQNGIMVLNISKSSVRTAFLHELGHYYDWGVGISNTPKWRAAVVADFRGMSPELRQDMGYLANPAEAFAELFAAHYEGNEYYAHDWYHVAAMPHASALLTARLCDGGK
jgi:hypothetical protein